MGKFAEWLRSGAPSSRNPYAMSEASPYDKPEYANASPQFFDAARMGGLRRALDSRALGQPIQDYNALSAHMTGLVYLSVNLIATLVANAELKLYERDDDNPDGKVRLPYHHPLCRLYHNPNRIDTKFDLLYQYIQQYELTGMGLMWTPPNRDPNKFERVEVEEMWSLPRVGMVLHPPTPDYEQGYWMAIPYGMYGNYQNGYLYSGAKIPAEQVMVFKKHHPWYRWEGYSILSAMAKSVDTLEAIDESRLSTQQQGTEQSVAVEFDPQVLQPPKPEMDRIRAEWFAEYSGAQNAGKIVFMGGGAKIHKFATTPAEMAWQEGWSQVAEYLLSAFGTTKALIGMVDGMTHSTLYGSLKANHLTKLVPLLNNLSARHEKDVIHKFYSDDYLMELEADAIHDDDLVERRIESDDRAGIRTIEERRRERGLPSLGQPWEKERSYLGGPVMDESGGPGHPTAREKDDKEVGERAAAEEAKRPDNAAGRGSLGRRNGKHWAGSGDRAEQLLHAMEGLKSKGVIDDLDHPNGRVQVPTN